MNRTRHVMMAAALALAACLTSCANTPENQAKKQRYAAIGEGLLNLGVKTKYITPETADLIREGGAIILETKGEPATPVIQAAPAQVPTPSGKEPVEVVPFAYSPPLVRPEDLSLDAPPTGPPRLIT